MKKAEEPDIAFPFKNAPFPFTAVKSCNKTPSKKTYYFNNVFLLFLQVY